MPEVITLGECMALLYPEEAVSLAQATSFGCAIAGAESNCAIGLSRLGHSVQFISRVGADPFGQRIRATLEAEGVDTSLLINDAQGVTGVFFREWLPDGQRRVFYYRTDSAASRMRPEDLPPAMLHGARILHLTGITPALSQTCAATVRKAIELAQEAGGLVSFDPNYRAKLWDIPTARATLLPLIKQADIVLMGHEDAQALFDLKEEELLPYLIACGVQIAVLKRAERGAWARTAQSQIEIPAVAVERVVDPVGAGDGFNAGFLAGWLRGYSLEDALHLGARVGAAAVSSSGDYTGYPRA